ncbi:MAG TPA: amino acid permease, partial [Acidobacteriota bacterium]|nr:amino acid permease [Acidobacteriota bacterium]
MGNATPLLRTIGLFDFTMIVMGGIIGSGIFMNPSVVARQVHTPHLILGVWCLGGVIALIAAFIWSELAEYKPYVGGQYAYLRDAYHPLAGFLYGWTLLLVIQTGGMAAVALTFARYFLELFPADLPDWWIAAVTLISLSVINCLGVRAGSALQSALMVIKIIAILTLIAAGFFHSGHSQNTVRASEPFSLGLFSLIGAGMVPVLFAYG